MSAGIGPLRLVPFAAAGPHGTFCLTFTAERQAGRLAVAWHLAGDLAALDLPPAVLRPARRDSLWRGTCFELFLAVAGDPAYRELNLAPSGDWNAYRFEGYRRGGRTGAPPAALPFAVERAGDRLEIRLELPLAGIVEEEAELDLGPAAVLAGAEGAVSHWALRHEGPRPDFHRRNGFLLRC